MYRDKEKGGQQPRSQCCKDVWTFSQIRTTFLRRLSCWVHVTTGVSEQRMLHRRLFHGNSWAIHLSWSRFTLLAKSLRKRIQSLVGGTAWRYQINKKKKKSQTKKNVNNGEKLSVIKTETETYLGNPNQLGKSTNMLSEGSYGIFPRCYREVMLKSA